MLQLDRISSDDLRAARLLLSLGVEAAARACRVSHDTLQRLESALNVRLETRVQVAETLQGMGVIFIEPGHVHHFDGRIAPTKAAVGVFHGERIRKARWRLAWPQGQLASKSGVGLPTIRSMEAKQQLGANPNLDLYRVVGALQSAGMVFSASRRGRRGDRCLVPRPLLWNRSRNQIRDYQLPSRPLGRRVSEEDWEALELEFQQDAAGDL